MSKAQDNLVLDCDGIKALLPHRYPFLLVDRVIDVVLDERITALKNVTVNEPFFAGHFPQRPVMPGVLLLEALAQTAGLLMILSKQQDKDAGKQAMFFLAGIDGARFKRMVVPGDQLRLEAEVLNVRRNLMKHKTSAYVGDALACSAEIMCASES